MDWYILIAIAALLICILVFATQFFTLLKMGPPKDLSKKGGDTGKAVVYSFTKAMTPKNKESAYMHLPTYAAGLIYHMGTFLSLALFVVIVAFKIAGITLPYIISLIVAIILFMTAAAGFGVLLKRVVKKDLRAISGPDDYISNLLTTGAQLLSALYLLYPGTEPLYFLVAALLFLWMPVGKTRHLLYFFFARYHLGYFYGWRGTWPQ